MYKLNNGDEATIYPCEPSSNDTHHSLTPPLHHPLRFIADVPVGKLAKELRMLGFDTAYQNDFDNRQVAEIAERENRIVLTRDISLLKHKQIKWAYWLRSQHVQDQLSEVTTRYQLGELFYPFIRCIQCNGLIKSVEKSAIQHVLPQRTAIDFNEFYQCENCQKVYWKGSHYEHMLEKIKNLQLKISTWSN